MRLLTMTVMTDSGKVIEMGFPNNDREQPMFIKNVSYQDDLDALRTIFLQTCEDIADPSKMHYHPVPAEIKERLAYLRQEIEAERISQGEIAELQDLAAYLEGDTLLLEWAGVPEFDEAETPT